MCTLHSWWSRCGCRWSTTALVAPSLIKTPLPSSGSGERLGSGSVSTEPRNVITVPSSLGAIAARRTFYHPTAYSCTFECCWALDISIRGCLHGGCWSLTVPIFIVKIINQNHRNFRLLSIYWLSLFSVLFSVRTTPLGSNYSGCSVYWYSCVFTLPQSTK